MSRTRRSGEQAGRRRWSPRLVQLREALKRRRLPLDLPDVRRPAGRRPEMIDQLEDYVLPRLIQIDAPLLTVVGGSTGAGKSTLVNSLVGERVTEPGVLRPTTRSPVLVHNPRDADWFDQDADPARPRAHHRGHRRPRRAPAGRRPRRSPPGLAVLDAPDIDSVEEQNRTLAAQLLGAADLWLFVTSAARYADQVPWDFLKQAAERSAAVAIVLDRTQPAADQRGQRATSPACSPRVGCATRRCSSSPRARSTSTVCCRRARSARSGPGSESLAADAEARTGGRAPDPGRCDPLDREAHLRRGRRRRRAVRDRAAAARATSTEPTTRRWPRSTEATADGTPAAGRGALPVAGVRRHRRAAQALESKVSWSARPGHQRCARASRSRRSG